MNRLYSFLSHISKSLLRPTRSLVIMNGSVLLSILYSWQVHTMLVPTAAYPTFFHINFTQSCKTFTKQRPLDEVPGDLRTPGKQKVAKIRGVVACVACYDELAFSRMAAWTMFMLPFLFIHEQEWQFMFMFSSCSLNTENAALTRQKIRFFF